MTSLKPSKVTTDEQQSALLCSNPPIVGPPAAETPKVRAKPQHQWGGMGRLTGEYDARMKMLRARPRRGIKPQDSLSPLILKTGVCKQRHNPGVQDEFDRAISLWRTEVPDLPLEGWSVEKHQKGVDNDPQKQHHNHIHVFKQVAYFLRTVLDSPT